MPLTYVLSFVHPDTRARLRYYGAARDERTWLDDAPSRVHELADWFGAEAFSIEPRRRFATLEQARSFARALSHRLKLHLRSEWLNGTDYSGPVHLMGDAGDRRGPRNPMHGRRHNEASRAAMSAAKRGRAWVHRGEEARQVSADELESALARGWARGRPRKRVT